uniref:Uncharacterized protein n=1 Tax=Ditylenchus dipsaci TaxID=166011 RepID=A0A915DLI8_9BILA
MVIPIKESPKYLLINRNDRAAAKEALIYYQGEYIDHEQYMNDTLKEAEDTLSDRTSLQILVELFTKPHLRSHFLGMCTLHAILGVWPITTRLLKDHFTPEMSQVYSTSLFGVNFVAGVIGSFVVSSVYVWIQPHLRNWNWSDCFLHYWRSATTPPFYWTSSFVFS